MDEPARYRKMAKGGWFGSGGIWLEEDHLLQVSSSFGVERYRRFYLRDIEALIVRETRLRFAGNIVLAVLALCGGLSIAGLAWLRTVVSDPQGDTAILVFIWIIGVVSVLILLTLSINTMFGPTCACFVRTQSGTDRLAVPTRLRAARRFVREVTPRIEAAQIVK